ncbi:MAG: hypothetical protein HYX47_15760 [Burkholderiales bacterium]|nr:hypothetical protein [Burkholderiales bacterium]
MGKLQNIAMSAVMLSAVSLTYLGVAQWQSSHRVRPAAAPVVVGEVKLGREPVVVAAMQAPVEAVAALAPAPAPSRPEDGYYSQLRTKIRWVETRMGGDKLMTPDPDSRMLLAKSAAQRAGLHEVGLGFKDVYGIINAETSWVPRLGASKNGTPNLGIAQFEPATARALGLRDPNDMVEAVHVAARHMKEAALWSADRIAGLKLGAAQRAEKLREGVSIYYNLSSRGRSVWNGRNTAKLPSETQKHILNARIGAQQAVMLDAQLQAFSQSEGKGVVLASMVR